jgi:hypothetical protein
LGLVIAADFVHGHGGAITLVPGAARPPLARNEGFPALATIARRTPSG